jgi:hypothetical protein
VICCGISGILFQMQIVEGKDRPKELPSPTKNKKNTSLLLEFFVQDYLGKLLFCP